MSSGNGYSAAVLTISTSGAGGTRVDGSGPVAREILAGAGFAVAEGLMVRDDRSEIGSTLTRWCDNEGYALIVTTGGTGLAPSDVTPEATTDVIERLVPGIPEAMRVLTLPNTPMAMLSRAVAGTRGRSLIVNVPGSPVGVRECLGVILPVLDHALAVLYGDASDHRAHGRI